jgi:hypothetical protein
MKECDVVEAEEPRRRRVPKSNQQVQRLKKQLEDIKNKSKAAKEASAAKLAKGKQQLTEAKTQLALSKEQLAAAKKSFRNYRHRHHEDPLVKEFNAMSGDARGPKAEALLARFLEREHPGVLEQREVACSKQDKLSQRFQTIKLSYADACRENRLANLKDARNDDLFEQLIELGSLKRKRVSQKERDHLAEKGSWGKSYAFYNYHYSYRFWLPMPPIIIG